MNGRHFGALERLCTSSNRSRATLAVAKRARQHARPRLACVRLGGRVHRRCFRARNFPVTTSLTTSTIAATVSTTALTTTFPAAAISTALASAALTTT